MGTLGCINDMLQRDKENRELRKLSKERLKETGSWESGTVLNCPIHPLKK